MFGHPILYGADLLAVVLVRFSRLNGPDQRLKNALIRAPKTFAKALRVIMIALGLGGAHKNL